MQSSPIESDPLDSELRILIGYSIGFAATKLKTYSKKKFVVY